MSIKTPVSYFRDIKSKSENGSVDSRTRLSQLCPSMSLGPDCRYPLLVRGRRPALAYVGLCRVCAHRASLLRNRALGPKGDLPRDKSLSHTGEH